MVAMPITEAAKYFPLCDHFIIVHTGIFNARCLPQNKYILKLLAKTFQPFHKVLGMQLLCCAYLKNKTKLYTDEPQRFHKKTLHLSEGCC